MPIIIATKMNVSPHYGLSLGSTHGTTISVDPPIPDAQKLKTWRSNNPKAIIECIAEVDRIIKKQQTSLDMVTKFQSIAEVVKVDNQEKFTLKVKAKITNLKQNSTTLDVKNAMHLLLLILVGMWIAQAIIRQVLLCRGRSLCSMSTMILECWKSRYLETKLLKSVK